MHRWRERFASRLGELKATEGMTQQALADEIGVSQSTIAGWLHGRREPESVKQFERLADALKVDPAWLLCGVERSQGDTDLLERWHQLPAEQQAVVMNLLVAMTAT